MSGYKLKTYACVLVSKKNPKHETPIECATLKEIQLLAFIHGVESLPTARIKPLGERQIPMSRDAAGNVIYVSNETDEYQRLAAKYETRVNPGKGKKYVEDCFKVTLGGFDHIIQEVNAIEAIESAVNQAERDEASKVIAAGGAMRAEAERVAESAPAVTPEAQGVGSRLFKSLPGAG
jgi:hypothetical protein